MPHRIAYIDGRRLRDAVIAGAQHLIARREHLDKINVFPVPDADTGTNMAAAARHMVDVLRGSVRETLHETADVIAEAALIGGRGNSGAILAQFFQGMSEGLASADRRIPTAVFADAVVYGAASARLAVSEPREGTILTVMREWADSFKEFVRSGSDLVEAFESALDVAQETLERTPDHLSILREASVVDAGAQGFLYLLEGVHALIRQGRPELREIVDSFDDDDLHLENLTSEPGYRWCTECLLDGKNLDRSEIKTLAESFGDSVVVAGSTSRVRLHVHTDRPGDLFAALKGRATISREKTDDMVAQFRHARRPPQQSVGIVTDTGCDLPDDVLRELNVHQVPFRVSFGDEQYIDKVTLTPDRFYDLLRSSSHHPKTAQPAPADFARAYQLVAHHYQSALSIHVPGLLSGTLQAAQLAASQISDRIRVVDSNSGSVGMGLVVLEAAEAARDGCSEHEILERVDAAIGRLTAYFSMETTEYLVKGGRISRTRGLVGRLLNVRVIFRASPKGEIEIVERLYRGRDARPAMVDRVMKGVANQRDVTIAIAHAAAPETAAWYVEAFRKRLNPRRILVAEFSPALGCHTGQGAMAIAGLGRVAQ